MKDPQQEFEQSFNGDMFTRLLIHYGSITSKEERDNQKDDDIIIFEFPFGNYTIKYGELKQAAKAEYDKLLKDTTDGNNN